MSGSPQGLPAAQRAASPFSAWSPCASWLSLLGAAICFLALAGVEWTCCSSCDSCDPFLGICCCFISTGSKAARKAGATEGCCWGSGVPCWPLRVYFMGSTQAQCRTGRRWVHPPTVATPESQLAVGSGRGHIQLCNQAQCDEGPSVGPFSLSLTVFQLPRTCINSDYQFTTDSHERQPGPCLHI